MSRHRWSFTIALLAVACTRENPQFGAGDSEPTGAETAMPTTSRGTADGSGVGPGDDTRSGTSVGMSGTTTDGPMSTTDGGETASPPPPRDAGMAETGDEVCVPAFVDPLLPEVVGDIPMMRACPPMLTLGVMIIAQQTPTMINARLCPDCPCDSGEVRDVTFPVEMEGPEGCFFLHVQLSSLGPSCEIDAYSITQESTVYYVTSNVYDPIIPEPFGFEMDPESVELCGTAAGCFYEPGHYGLINADGYFIPPDFDTHDVLADDEFYDVYNLGSGIDEACQPVARWHAELVE